MKATKRVLMMVVLVGLMMPSCVSLDESEADGGAVCDDSGSCNSNDGQINGNDVEDGQSEWSYCPKDSGVSDGEDLSRVESCDGHFTDVSPTEEDARNFYRRLMHEVDHVRDVITTGDESELIRQVGDGEHLEGSIDNGFVSGVVRSQNREDATASCATLRFECWSGGHGGFGPAALEGDLQLLVEEPTDATNPTIRVKGSAGLVESESFQGTPRMDIDIAAELSQADGWISEGTIGDFAVGGFQVTH